MCLGSFGRNHEDRSHRSRFAAIHRACPRHLIGSAPQGNRADCPRASARRGQHSDGEWLHLLLGSARQQPSDRYHRHHKRDAAEASRQEQAKQIQGFEPKRWLTKSSNCRAGRMTSGSARRQTPDLQRVSWTGFSFARWDAMRSPGRRWDRRTSSTSITFCRSRMAARTGKAISRSFCWTRTRTRLQPRTRPGRRSAASASSIKACGPKRGRR